LIPRSLSEWNYDRVKELVDRGYLEDDAYDFKLAMKSSDPKLIDKIRILSCAFANTDGGFIIFGVEDWGNKKEDRIAGIQKSDDLAKEFGDILMEIDPVPYFDFKNPPLKIPNKNTVLFIAHILQSPERPHMYDGKFYYRGNKGNETMTHQQVKEYFLRYEERRSKLKLLYTEIFSNSIIAQEIIEVSNKEITSNSHTQERFLHYSPLRFEVTVISSILPDIFSIIQEDNEMLVFLLRLRLQLSTINSKINGFLMLNPEDMEFQSSTHNEYIRKHLTEFTIPLINIIMEKMESKYHLIIPFPDRKFEIFKKL
jgi:Putative DNA-binding domain